MKKPRPRQRFFDDGSEWWFCPICEAGWKQYKNLTPGRARQHVIDCIDHHINKTDGNNASHLIIGVVHNPESNEQIKREITKAFDINKGRLM